MPSHDPLALYIHWPFCISKCPYCDFNSHVRESVDQVAWCDALLADLAHEATLLPNRTLGSVFFGGGTPSLMPPATVAALIDAATSAWPVSEDLEITLEANPSSVEAARFADLALAGVNRVSLGIQALRDADLHMLGRAHSTAEALDALTVAQTHFARVNFDLIYARPDQSQADWNEELGQALALGTSHLSLYQLTIEAGTRFETLVRQGTMIPPDMDHAAALYELTQDRMQGAGIPAYEVSNHARAGEQSRHNLCYWRYQDYVGIGPGAHGRRKGQASVRHKKPENWIAAVTRNGHGLMSEDRLTPEERAREALVMGLRLAEGVDLDRISARCGLAQIVNDKTIALLAAEALIQRSGPRLTVTPKGMLLLDAILAAIVTA
jgi:putative oxygen-independent coproporphyrinogen III oxidase